MMNEKETNYSDTHGKKLLNLLTELLGITASEEPEIEHEGALVVLEYEPYP